MKKIAIVGNFNIQNINPTFILSILECYDIQLHEYTEIYSREGKGVDLSVENFVRYYNSSLTDINNIPMAQPIFGGEIHPLTGQMLGEPIPSLPGKQGKKIPLINMKRIFPEYEKYGKIADKVQAQQLANLCDSALLIWNGRDEKIKYIKKVMRDKKKRIYQILLSNLNEETIHA